MVILHNPTWHHKTTWLSYLPCQGRVTRHWTLFSKTLIISQKKSRLIWCNCWNNIVYLISSRPTLFARTLTNHLGQEILTRVNFFIDIRMAAIKFTRPSSMTMIGKQWSTSFYQSLLTCRIRVTTITMFIQVEMCWSKCNMARNNLLSLIMMTFGDEELRLPCQTCSWRELKVSCHGCLNCWNTTQQVSKIRDMDISRICRKIKTFYIMQILLDIADDLSLDPSCTSPSMPHTCFPCSLILLTSIVHNKFGKSVALDSCDQWKCWIEHKKIQVENGKTFLRTYWTFYLIDPTKR